jgi:uncharacterized membrane protein YGL010W
VGILGLGCVTRTGSLDLAATAAVAVLILFAALDPRSALISLIVLAVLVLFRISTRLSWQVSLGAFIFGWGIQFMGHNREDTKLKELSIRVRR